MVVDAKTGKVLYSENPDALRHPASITKVMTLYLLFEQLQRGKMTLDTELTVSAYAARQAPSKLGLNPGDTIRVEDAIKAVVTKSANDIAVVIAESIGGSEQNFAAMMTRKAHALGMNRTTYRNASGLPNPGQITTARDLITLGRAIQDRFPREYAYFQTRVFNYDGDAHANHNKLLGRVEGVDGIKTGFTQASGFNLLTSAKLDGRHVVAAVLGGRSGPSRDAIMADLVEEYLPKASSGPRTSPIVAENDREEQPVTTAALTTKSQASDARPPISKTTAEPPRDNSAAQGKPVVAQGDEAGQSTAVAQAPSTTPSQPAPPVLATAGSVSALGWKEGAPGIASTAMKTASLAPTPIPVKTPAAKITPPKPATWSIEIGTAETEAKAKALLNKAQARLGFSKAMASADKIKVKRQTVWLASVSGYTETSAATACKTLKKAGMSCQASKD
jgi:D-alanyl-D-alanine carboxypeptidase